MYLCRTLQSIGLRSHYRAGGTVELDSQDPLLEEPPAHPLPPMPRPPAPQEGECRGDFDKIVDFVLRCVSCSFANTSAEKAVPNIDVTYPITYGIFSAQCHLTAKAGVVGNLASLFRDGAARVHEEQDGAIVLEAAAGLRNVCLRYDNFSLQVGIFPHSSGTLKLNVSPLTLRMSVVLRPPSMAAELRELRLESAGRLHLEATGLSLLQPLLPAVQSWLNNNAVPIMSRVVGGYLQQTVADTLSAYSRRIETIPRQPDEEEDSPALRYARQREENEINIRQERQKRLMAKEMDTLLLLDSVPSYFGKRMVN